MVQVLLHLQLIFHRDSSLHLGTGWDDTQQGPLFQGACLSQSSWSQVTVPMEEDAFTHHCSHSETETHTKEGRGALFSGQIQRMTSPEDLKVL